MQPCCVKIPFVHVDDVLSSGRLEGKGSSEEDYTLRASSPRGLRVSMGCYTHTINEFTLIIGQYRDVKFLDPDGGCKGPAQLSHPFRLT